MSYTPLVCPTPVNGACFNSANPAPYNEPMTVLGPGHIRIAYTWNTSHTKFAAYNLTTQVPESLNFKMCYSNINFADRAWRKKNKPYPSVSTACFYTTDMSC